MRAGAFLLTSFIMAVPAGAQMAARVARADAYLKRLVPLGFAGNAFVVHEGRVLLKRAYGLADRAKKTRMTEDAVMTTGSLTKQFTGAAIAKLVAAGKIALTDTLPAFFEDVPEDKRGITVRMLLTHASGLPEAVGHDHDTSLTRDAVLRNTMAAELRFSPGSQRRYSNAGYTLLAMILEKVTKQGYEQHLRDVLFRPAGMKSTGYVLAEHQGKPFPTGYRKGAKTPTFVDLAMGDEGPSWALRGNGGILTTVSDMVLWDRVLRDGKLLGDANASYCRALRGGGDNGYGYGWAFTRTRRGTRMMEHDGGNMVFSADMHRYLDEDVSLFVQSSVAELSAMRVIEPLEAIVFGHPQQLPPVVREVAAERLASHAGRYELPSGEVVDVRVRRGALHLAAKAPGVLSELMGTAGATKAERELAERSLALTRAWTGGDFAPMAAVFGGRASKDHLEKVLSDSVARQKRRRGELAGISVHAIESSDGRARVRLRVQHARGAWLLGYHWRGGKITEIGMDVLDREDGAGASRVRLWPVSDGELVTFDVSSPRVLRVRFEEGGMRVLSARGTPLARRK